MQVWLTACGKTASIASGKPLEAVGADEEHVLDAAVAQIGEHARPEAGALGLLDPQAKHVTFALERNADSDIDGLVRFAPGTHRGLLTFGKIESELEALLGRKVDLVPRAAIEESENYIRKQAILGSAQTIYAA